MEVIKDVYMFFKKLLIIIERSMVAIKVGTSKFREEIHKLTSQSQQKLDCMSAELDEQRQDEYSDKDNL